MALSSFGKSALRVTKNYGKGYSHTQIKTRNATCNDPWPPSGKEMFELAQMSYNQSDFVDIMEVIDKRLNDKGKNWRHVFKSLVVLDYLLHSGSENVILYCQENIYEIKTLREFQFLDEEGRDQGANVRQKAKDITNLLMDQRRLSQERLARARMRDRLLGRTSSDTEEEDDDEYRPPVRPLSNGFDSGRPRSEEEEALRKAIEESKKSASQDLATAEDKDVQRAIKLSQDEEERRKRLMELAAATLFDEQNPETSLLIDASLPLQYTNGVQPQYTAVQPQYTALQPQYTSYNPYLQQAQQEAMQAEYMRQQAEYARLQLEAQNAAALQQAMLLQQQQQQQQPLIPQPTAIGSNNPFAHPTSVMSGPSSPTIPERPVSLPARDAPMSFTLTGTYDRQQLDWHDREEERERERERERALLRPYSTGAEPRRGRQSEDARLANLFANYTGDGVDTFGNVGQLRFGATEYGRIAAQKTGGENLNPFLNDREASRSQRSALGRGSGNLIDF